MAWRDAAFIAAQLQHWSKEFNLTWDLMCEGQAQGQIRHGVMDTDAQLFLDSLHTSTDIPEDEHEARIAFLRTEYADRWDDEQQTESQMLMLNRPLGRPSEGRNVVSTEPGKGFWSRPDLSGLGIYVKRCSFASPSWFPTLCLPARRTEVPLWTFQNRRRRAS